MNNPALSRLVKRLHSSNNRRRVSARARFLDKRLQCALCGLVSDAALFIASQVLLHGIDIRHILLVSGGDYGRQSLPNSIRLLPGELPLRLIEALVNLLGIVMPHRRT